MKLDLYFLVVAIIIGAFVDYVFQWAWEAKNKSLWGKNDNKVISFIAVSMHSFIYSSLTSFTALWITGHLKSIPVVFIVLFVSHAVIDTRIPVRYIMRFKGISWEDINNGNLRYLEAGIDQRLHEMVLLILAVFV